MNVDWNGITQAVALEVLGEPRLRRENEWRYGSRGSLSVKVGGPLAGSWYDFEVGRGGGALQLLEHSLGLERSDALAWLKDRGLLSSLPSNVREDPVPGLRAPGKSAVHPSPKQGENHLRAPRMASQRSGPESLQRRNMILDSWRRCEPIPTSPDHPARRWLAARNLWRPELPTPGALRWLPAADHYQGRGPHLGAGSLVALAAPPESWQEAWPGLPAPQAVQLVAIDATGEPTLDRPAQAGGLGKRTIGTATGSVVLFGNPILAESSAPVRVAEGLADALALTSRYPGPALATLGTSTMQGRSLAEWIAGAAAGVVVHADADTAKNGRPPAGAGAARSLCRQVESYGGQAAAFLPASGKDPADAARNEPFGQLEEGWVNYARQLQQETDWPGWEISRQASFIPSAGGPAVGKC